VDIIGTGPVRPELQAGQLLSGAEHVGLVVPCIKAAMRSLGQLGHCWSPIARPRAILRRGGQVEENDLLYVTTSGPLPRIKIIQEVTGSYWRPDREGLAFHHLSYWVDDLTESTEHLLSGGNFRIDADGLNPDGTLRYRYLIGGAGIRIELGLRANREEFERWAGETSSTA
jgi:hypothetical protein